MARPLLLRRLLLLHILNMAALTSAYDFHVGGNGWTLNPSESYNSWAGKMRFQVNDKLVFKYKKGEDSVLQVTKEAYDSCNRSKPIRAMDDGDSIFQLDRSGPFFFISGARGRCEQGQKLIVVVLAVRHNIPSTMPPAPAPRQPMAPEPGPASIAVPTPVSSPTIFPAPSADSPATSTVGSGGVVPSAEGPATSTPGSASSVLSVSRFALAVVVLVLGGVFVS